jgi:autotransporter-associated beta strand protein
VLGKIKMGNRGAAPVIGRRLAKFLRVGLLASTALISVHAAALADGGTGGTPLHGDAGGGTGGSGPYGANGNSGSSSSTFRGYVASGGGGGGAGSGVNNGGTGGTGGGGQDNDPGLGGAGGTAASPDGQAGGNAGTSYTSNAGGGGGGGGYSAFSGAALSNSGGTTLTGGNGGDGGNGSTPTGGANYFSAGGGGGEGGYGAVVTGAAASSNLGTVTGGTGGAGGAGLTAGNGGDGGIGIDFMASGATFTNGGAATGGAGGAVGGFYGGNSGAGGVGVVGSGLTVINSGSISGGLGSDGVTRADAIDFTGGSNSLTLSSGGTIGTLTGGIGITGSLSIDPGTSAGSAVTLSNVIHDLSAPGSLTKIGAGTLILSGANTYSGGTTISAGTLQVQNDSALGTGSVTLDGGTLQAGADTMTVSNAFKINPSGGTIDMDGNGVLVLNGAITDGNGANGTLTIINSSGTTSGTVILSSTGNTYSGATVIGNGASGPNDVILADESGGNFSPNSAVTVTANSYLGLNGDETIGSLAGAGTVITEGFTTGKTLTTGGDNSSTTFSGVLQDFQGALSLTKTGTGTMTLSGANTYSGATVIDAGTLALEGSGRILNSSSVEDDGTFDISQTSGATIQNLTGNGRIALGSQTLNVQNTANSAFSGSIADGGIAGGTGGGIFVSTGRETLTGDNTYTGTTLIGNELFLSGNGSIASSSLVRVLGIFDISGTTAGASVKNLIGTGDINLGSQTLTITAGAGDFDGIIEDGGADGGVTIAGGSMSLDRSNTYTGATTIDSGAMLLIAGVGSIASSSGVQDDGIFDISGGPGVTSIQNLTGNGGVALGGHLLTIEAANGTFSGNISGSGGSLTIDGGTETLTGDNSFTGVMTVTGGGTLKLSGSGSIASSVEVYDGVPGGGGGTFDISGTTAGASIKTLAGIGSVKLGNQTLTITAANTTYEGTIGDGGLGGGLTISGGTATFAATSTYTGATKIDAGATLDLRYSASIASSSGVEDDGTLAISGNGDNSIKSLTGNGTLQLFNMALNITAANGTFSGSITNNAGGNGGLTLSGGSETLTGDSPSYIGNTTVGSNATLIVGNDNAVGTGSVSMAANSTMGVTGNITLANNFLIAGDPTYDVETGNSLTLSGVIADGGSPGTLEKTGGGTLTLNAANTYTGATVIDAGTLALGASGAISASSGVENDGAFDISGISAGASIKSLAGTGAADLGTQDLTLTSASGTFGGAIAGSGTFSIQGGTETLSGSSENFTGALEVFSGATLDLTGNASIANASQLYDGGTVDISGSDGISVAGINGGGEIILGDQTLTITGDNTVVYAGDITGDGGVTITGSEAFTNAQHYTGQTTVGSGGNLSLLTSGDISASSGVEDNGTFDISNINTDSTTIAALSGSGAVHLGDNTLIIAHGLGVFSGSFTAGTGGVTLAGGTTTITGDTGVPFAVDAGAALQLGDGGTLGAVTDNVVNNGTVIFDRSDTVTYSTLITGSGDLTQAGTGTLIVDSAIAPGNVTVSNGTLQVGTGGNTGSLGSANVTDNGVLAFDRSDTVTITRAISGSGDLDMIGSGTLIYDAQGSATGLTTVSSGTLEVGDSNTPAAFLSGGVDVLSGGTLMGHGAVNGDVTVGSGGTLRPGGTIGTLTVNGNVSLAAGSTFVEEVSPAAGDRLNVSGAATLKGALDVVQDSGTYAAGTDYTIVSANSVTGTFSSVSGDVFPGLTADVVYSATAVDLVLSTSGKPIVKYNFPTYGITPNQKAAGAALNKASPGGDLYKTAGGLVTSDSSGAPGVLEELAGDIHASVATAAINESRMVRDTLLGELDDRQEPRRYLWIDGYGNYGNTGSDGNAGGMHTTTGGLIGGIDIPLLDAMRVGIAGACSSDTVTTERHQSRADGHLAHIIGYAAYDAGNFAINAAVDYGSGSSATSRSLEDFGERDAAHRDQSLTQEFGRVSYRVNNDVFPVVPYLGLVHVESRTGAFAESGGITALSGDSANDDVTYSLLGVRAAMDSLVVGNSMMLTPRADFAWDHAFNHFIPAQLLTYENTGNSFAVQGAPLAQDSAAVEIGADLAINSSITISLTYDGLFSNSAQNNAVRGGLAWKF